MAKDKLRKGEGMILKEISPQLIERLNVEVDKGMLRALDQVSGRVTLLIHEAIDVALHGRESEIIEAAKPAAEAIGYCSICGTWLPASKLTVRPTFPPPEPDYGKRGKIVVCERCLEIIETKPYEQKYVRILSEMSSLPAIIKEPERK